MSSITKLFIVAAWIFLSFTSCHTHHQPVDNGWGIYGGNNSHDHYAALTQIDTNNVMQLQEAWQYHTGDSDKMTQIQVNPIIVDDVLYGVSPKLKLFAVDAATGKAKWIFDPLNDTSGEVRGARYFSMNVCRGVTYYSGGDDEKRIFYGAGPRLYCIDALRVFLFYLLVQKAVSTCTKAWVIMRRNCMWHPPHLGSFIKT